MIVPMIYYVLIVVWQPRGFKARIQYLVGLVIYVFIGPFINVTVLVYALWSLDNFAWGKTRRVVETVQTVPGELDEKYPRRKGKNKLRKSPRTPRSLASARSPRPSTNSQRFDNLPAEESQIQSTRPSIASQRFHNLPAEEGQIQSTRPSMASQRLYNLPAEEGQFQSNL